MKISSVRKAINKLPISEIEAIYTTKKISSLEEQLKSLRHSVGLVSKPFSTVKKSRKGTKKSTVKKVRRSARKNQARIINEVSLKERLTQIASDGVIRNANQFIEVLDNTGWKTSSTNRYQIVAAALAKLKDKNKFERVNKGEYRIINI